MKKLFIVPSLTVDMFASEDVIAASYEVNGDTWHEVGGNGNDNGRKICHNVNFLSVLFSILHYSTIFERGQETIAVCV